MFSFFFLIRAFSVSKSIVYFSPQCFSGTILSFYSSIINKYLILLEGSFQTHFFHSSGHPEIIPLWTVRRQQENGRKTGALGKKARRQGRKMDSKGRAAWRTTKTKENWTKNRKICKKSGNRKEKSYLLRSRK